MSDQLNFVDLVFDINLMTAVTSMSLTLINDRKALEVGQAVSFFLETVQKF